MIAAVPVITRAPAGDRRRVVAGGVVVHAVLHHKDEDAVGGGDRQQVHHRRLDRDGDRTEHHHQQQHGQCGHRPASRVGHVEMLVEQGLAGVAVAEVIAGRSAERGPQRDQAGDPGEPASNGEPAVPGGRCSAGLPVPSVAWPRPSGRRCRQAPWHAPRRGTGWRRWRPGSCRRTDPPMLLARADREPHRQRDEELRLGRRGGEALDRGALADSAWVEADDVEVLAPASSALAPARRWPQPPRVPPPPAGGLVRSDEMPAPRVAHGPPEWSPRTCSPPGRRGKGTAGCLGWAGAGGPTGRPPQRAS